MCPFMLYRIKSPSPLVLLLCSLISVLSFLADVSGFQVGSHPQEGTQGQASYDAALYSQAAQDPDKVSGSAMEEK